MTEFLSAHEPMLRLGVFLAIALGMAGWEMTAPRRPLSRSRGHRWPVNAALVMLDTALVRLLFPAAVVAGIAVWTKAQGIGLFNLVALPEAVAIVASVVLLDLAIYAQHLIFHHVRPLWRLHRIHHMDLDVDFTTGIRFHPVEIILSVLIKFGAVVALGAPVAAVVTFEALLNGSSMFNHGNVRLPPAVDRFLRAVVVTPDMHRVHHSVVRAETNSNFGFCLSVWDRLFGTYRDQPAAGHDSMTVGLPSFRDARDQGFATLLMSPLRPGPAW